MKQSGLIASAALGCVVLAVVSACGGGTGTGGSGGTGVTTGGSTTSKSSTAAGVTGATTTTGAGPTSSTATGAGGGCSMPSTLHPPMQGDTLTIYCPFSGTPNINCDPATTHCCEPKMGMATCDPNAQACPAGGMDWQCQDPKADCKDPAKPVCCATGASFGQGAPGCANFASKMTKTECVAASACAPDAMMKNLTMCTDDTECPMGKTCTPFKKAGAGVGACQ